jgi:threonine/homoserine/homoserine lactone efflux protein
MALWVITGFGAAYLLYLAYKVYRAPADFSINEGVLKKSGWRLFRQGFLMNVLNPKVTLFFLAFFPGFLFSDALPKPLQFYVLGVLFMLSAFLVFGSLALLAGKIAVYLKRNARAGWILKYVQVVVFVGIALYLLVSLK